MSFAATKTGEHVVGDLRMTRGTYTNGSGDTGGDINTGLHQCLAMTLTPSGSSAAASAPTVNETFPCAGNAVTVVTGDGDDGYWQAYGY